MPGILTHSPADVVRRVLIALGLGTDPSLSPQQSWPVFSDGEPDRPDSVITVYDTAGKRKGRTMTDGEVQEYHGIQIRIRSSAHSAGYLKARALAIALDGDVYQETVTIGSKTYLIHQLSRTSDVLRLGKESPVSKRCLFTINALAMVRQTN